MQPDCVREFLETDVGNARARQVQAELHDRALLDQGPCQRVTLHIVHPLV